MCTTASNLRSQHRDLCFRASSILQPYHGSCWGLVQGVILLEPPLSPESMAKSAILHLPELLRGALLACKGTQIQCLECLEIHNHDDLFLHCFGHSFSLPSSLFKTLLELLGFQLLAVAIIQPIKTTIQASAFIVSSTALERAIANKQNAFSMQPTDCKPSQTQSCLSTRQPCRSTRDRNQIYLFSRRSRCGLKV